jgi:RNA polymerase sigma factor (sigma-70 family)
LRGERAGCSEMGSRFGQAQRLHSMTGKRPFSEVVSLHGPAVLRVCRALLGPVDADDAWSETFLSALRAYPRLPGDANVEAWLVTIAHRKAIDLVRKASRSATPVADVPDQPAQASVDGGFDLAQSLARLPERQRHAVAYHYLAGLPYAEVAAVMGGTTDAARRAAADGIAKLRKARAASTHRDQTP